MKLLQKTGLFIAAALMVVACGPGNNTVETGDAQEVAAGSGMTLAVDASSSKINWTGYKPAGKHWGFIPLTEGEVMVEGESLTGARFVFDITGLKIEDMEESNEFYGKLWGHLQSADFFDAENHPQAVFELTSVEPFSAGSIQDKEEFVTEYTPAKDSELSSNPTHWISGNLTMRGVTKNIKFPATVSIANGSVAAKAGFNIDRTAWGLAYGDESNAVDKAKDQFIYNTVSVQFDIQAN
ncbi:YceI family protein [Cecembia rubra]|uniref:YceI family protein n=1 Tax=Cecembia rubra TaxID=1485585 RepID=UPI0027148625|nr:YceI family protein [Cecembia rubra]